jgi:hypothetical protein
MLEHLWCQDKPRTTSDSQDSPWPGLGGSHHLPPYSILYTSPRRPHPNSFLSQDSQREVLKLLRLELLPLCGVITSCSDLRSRQGLRQICNSCQDLSNGVSHVTCMHRIQINSRHFVIESQTRPFFLP